MSYTEDQLDKIYSRSSGYCHIFHKKLARTNYANFGGRAIRDEDRADYTAIPQEFKKKWLEV